MNLPPYKSQVHKGVFYTRIKNNICQKKTFFVDKNNVSHLMYLECKNSKLLAF